MPRHVARAMPIRWCLCAAVALLAGCSPDPSGQPNHTAATDFSAPTPASPDPVATANLTVPEPAEAPAKAASQTVGGDGSPITLTALQPGDTDALEGELGCSFSEREGGPALLVGKADVGKDARAFARVRNHGVLEPLAATSTGGFGAMEKGVTFGGKGLSLRLMPEARVPTGDESVVQRATLLVQRADGAERRIAGLWTCGP